MKGFTATITGELRGSHQLPPGREKLQLPTSRRSPTKAQREKYDKARGQVEDDCHTSCGSSLLQLEQWVSSQERQELLRYQTC